jgi:CheY-like chemotaxis protein
MEVKRLMHQFREEKKNGERELAEKEGLVYAGNAKAQGKKILIIDDEKVFIEMFGDKLRQDGYTVVSASDGTSGLEEALKGDYDIFVIDIIMPGMMGDEIIERLKQEEKTKNVPIVVLSVSVAGSDVEKIKDLGITAFYDKSKMIPSQLSKVVEEILEK